MEKIKDLSIKKKSRRPWERQKNDQRRLSTLN